jgi:predicted HD phosphohydrolase
VGAALLEPFVSEENHWMVKHHAIFQGYYFFEHLGLDPELREKYRDHPCFDRTVEFCAKYDAAAFDPEQETLPLSFFEPMLRRVMAKPKRSLYKNKLDADQQEQRQTA